MKTIAIVSHGEGVDQGLISILELLFPECDIRIYPCGSQNLKADESGFSYDNCEEETS